MRALVYAKSPAVYDALKLYLAKELSKTMEPDDDQADDDLPHEIHEEEDAFSDGDASEEDLSFLDDKEVSEVSSTAVRDARDDDDVSRGKSHRFFKYFTENWEGIQEEWVMFRRQNVAYLGNNTNNRIEAKFGAIKRVLSSSMDLEETIRALREMQSVNEDVYIESLIKPGTRHSYTGDTELDQLLNIVSDHAYELVLVSAPFLATAFVPCTNDLFRRRNTPL
jgi:hypothetical protein